MDKVELQYLQFPVHLLPHIFTDPKGTFKQIIAVGVFLFSQKVKAEPIQVAGQLIYCYIRAKKSLTKELNDFMCKIDNSTINGKCFRLYDDYCYNAGQNESFSFDGDDIIVCQMLEREPEVLKAATEWYRLRQALKYFKTNVNNFDIVLDRIKGIQTAGEPLCMVKMSIIWDYYDNIKSEQQLLQFCAYSAIKSILGQKPCLLTNKQHVVARMFGARSSKTIPEDIHPLFYKYMKRCHIDLLIEQLELTWGLKKITTPGLRGFYLSFKMGLTELALFAERQKLKNKRIELRQMKQDARVQAIQQLKKG
jgi:hypothetical protein